MKRQHPITARPSDQNQDHAATDPNTSSPTTHKPHTGVTRYDPEFALLICERIATTPKSLVKICEAPDMPGVASVFRWLREYPDFREMYLLAKELQAELLIEETLDLVDDTSEDFFLTADDKIVINPVAIQRCKLRVEHRKWLASKMLPRKYGHHQQQEQPPRSQRVTTSAPSPAPGEDNDHEGTLPETFRLQLSHLRRLMNGTPEEQIEAEEFHTRWTAAIEASLEPRPKSLIPKR